MNNRIYQLILILSFTSISQLAIGQGCGSCLSLVDIELSSTSMGITPLNPLDIFVGDISCVDTMYTTPSFVDCNDDGTLVPVVLTIEDLFGNIITCNSTAKPVDNAAPILTVPPNVTINSALGACGTIYQSGVSVTASDNCDIVTPMLISGIPDGSFYPVGINDVTWSVSDDNGNLTIKSYSVTVINIGPTAQNIWSPPALGGSSSWTDANNWSLTEIPTFCHDVVIPNNLPHPQINYGESAYAHTLTIEPDASLINNSGQIKSLNIFNQDKISFVNRGTFTNQGILTIGKSIFYNKTAIENYGTFLNSDGLITIGRTANNAIENKLGASFSNNSFMAIGKMDSIAVDSIGGHGIVNEGIFNNSIQLSITFCGLQGILNQSTGTFNNTNGLFIRSVSDDGIFNLGMFKNELAGYLSVQGTGKNGIRNPEGSFLNSKNIFIGNNTKIEYDGIWNQANFTNTADGNIEIDNTGFGGIANFIGGNIENSGKISIGYNGGQITHQAIYNSGILSNFSGGDLKLKGGTFSLLNVDVPIGGPGIFDIQQGSTLDVEP